MTVYEEVQATAKRNKIAHDDLAANKEATSAIKYFADSAKVNPEQERTWFLNIAALAIAAIEALDAEKGREAGNA